MASSVQHLIVNLSSEDDTVRMSARQSLIEMGSRTVPSLIEALRQGRKILRWEVIKTLSEIKDPKASPALVRALEDQNFDVRRVAAKGLIQMGTAGLPPPFLRALMMRKDSLLLREGAHRVIRELVGGGVEKVFGSFAEGLGRNGPPITGTKSGLDCFRCA
jgi:HEAT repeat protein